MRKSGEKPAKGNSAKYNSYCEAFTRIKSAQEGGWYFEAVTLQESILCDRLQSHLIGIGIQNIETSRSTVGSLLRAYKNSNCQTMSPELCQQLSSWWTDRNRVVHQFAKSFPASATENVMDSLSHARQTAANGDKLIRDVMKWYRDQVDGKSA